MWSKTKLDNTLPGVVRRTTKFCLATPLSRAGYEKQSAEKKNKNSLHCPCNHE